MKHNLVAKGHCNVTRGERPPIDLSTLTPESYESGRFLIRIAPEIHVKLPDILHTATATSYVQTGIPAPDHYT